MTVSACDAVVIDQLLENDPQWERSSSFLLEGMSDEVFMHLLAENGKTILVSAGAKEPDSYEIADQGYEDVFVNNILKRMLSLAGKEQNANQYYEQLRRIVNNREFEDTIFNHFNPASYDENQLQTLVWFICQADPKVRASFLGNTLKVDRPTLAYALLSQDSEALSNLLDEPRTDIYSIIGLVNEKLNEANRESESYWWRMAKRLFSHPLVLHNYLVAFREDPVVERFINIRRQELTNVKPNESPQISEGDHLSNEHRWAFYFLIVKDLLEDSRSDLKELQKIIDNTGIAPYLDQEFDPSDGRLYKDYSQLVSHFNDLMFDAYYSYSHEAQDLLRQYPVIAFKEAFIANDLSSAIRAFNQLADKKQRDYEADKKQRDLLLNWHQNAQDRPEQLNRLLDNTNVFELLANIDQEIECFNNSSSYRRRHITYFDNKYSDQQLAAMNKVLSNSEHYYNETGQIHLAQGLIQFYELYNDIFKHEESNLVNELDIVGHEI